MQVQVIKVGHRVHHPSMPKIRLQVERVGWLNAGKDKVAWCTWLPSGAANYERKIFPIEELKIA